MRLCSIKGCGKPHLANGWCRTHYTRARRHGDPLAVLQVQRHGLSLKDRLLANIEKTPSCWIWLGSLDNHGYGRMNVGGKPTMTHRVSWEVHKGPIPPGANVLHRCDNPRCVRPRHLFLGDHAANMADKMAKGRHRYGNVSGEEHGMAKLTAEQVLAIRADQRSLREVAAEYGLSRTHVWEIRTGRAWTHL